MEKEIELVGSRRGKYLFNPVNLNVRKVSRNREGANVNEIDFSKTGAYEFTGIRQTFLIGPTVICYPKASDEGNFIMLVKGVEEKIDSTLDMKSSRVGALYFGSVKLGKIQFRYLYLDWIRIIFPEFIMKRLDPTFDDLDKYENACWFSSRLLRYSKSG